jgi:hypothetical protein
MYAEKASTIAESLYLVDEEARTHWVKKDKYLLYVEDLGDDDDGDVSMEAKVQK